MSQLLPLFPLNSVLFPGAPIQLHIFEPRYKEMLRACLAGDRSFGVVLIKHGSEARGPIPEPYYTGCRAVIREVKPLSEGRSRLVAVGRERFKVASIVQDEPYLIGRVEYDGLADNPNRDLGSLAADVATRLLRYADIVSETSRDLIHLSDMPADPVSLAYSISSTLQIPLEEKQALLEMSDLDDMLKALARILDRELMLMPAMLSGGPVEGIGPFGWN